MSTAQLDHKWGCCRHRKKTATYWGIQN